MHLSTKIVLGFIIVSFLLSIIIDAIGRTFSVTSIFTYLFGLVVYYLILLDQNCVHEGPCVGWGWVKAAITILLFILLVGIKIFVLIAASKAKSIATTAAASTTPTVTKTEEKKKEETKTA